MLCLCYVYIELPFPVHRIYRVTHTHTHTFILWRLIVAILVTPRQKTNESLSWGLAAEVLELAGNAARDNEKTHIIPKHPTAGEIVAILDKIAGGGEAVRDKTAGEIEAILEAAERVEEFIVELVRLYLKPRNESTNLLSNHLLRLY